MYVTATVQAGGQSPEQRHRRPGPHRGRHDRMHCPQRPRASISSKEIPPRLGAPPPDRTHGPNRSRRGQPGHRVVLQPAAEQRSRPPALADQRRAADPDLLTEGGSRRGWGGEIHPDRLRGETAHAGLETSNLNSHRTCHPFLHQPCYTRTPPNTTNNI